MQELERLVDDTGVALVGSLEGPVAFGFTERTGGVSKPPYTSLNLGSHVGDAPEAIQENRRRVLAALGCKKALDRLIVPNQVHGDHVVIVPSSDTAALAEARAEAAAGADAVVCTVPGVPVLLCFADCVPVIVACPGGFAVVHSGWRGTYAEIAGTAARALGEATGCAPSDMRAYIGPHILGDEYEVSAELIEQFSQRFTDINPSGPRMLDLSRAITQALVCAGLAEGSVLDTRLSTVRHNDRFYSYRAENGSCGRHAAVAVMR